MAGYLASREHEVEGAKSETLTYRGKGLSMGQRGETGFETMGSEEFVDYVARAAGMTYNVTLELKRRLGVVK